MMLSKCLHKALTNMGEQHGLYQSAYLHNEVYLLNTALVLSLISTVHLQAPAPRIGVMCITIYNRIILYNGIH